MISSEWTRLTPSSRPPSSTVGPGDLVAVRGTIEHGDRRGRTIGFPTANLAVEATPILDGVWSGWVDVRGDRHAAAISVGSRPTFYGTTGFRLLEAHLLDFDADVYGESMTVWLCDKLREQIAFDSVDHLVAQLRRDVADARRRALLGPPPTLPPDAQHLSRFDVGAAVLVSAAPGRDDQPPDERDDVGTPVRSSKSGFGQPSSRLRRP